MAITMAKPQSQKEPRTIIEISLRKIILAMVGVIVTNLPKMIEERTIIKKTEEMSFVFSIAVNAKSYCT